MTLEYGTGYSGVFVQVDLRDGEPSRYYVIRDDWNGGYIEFYRFPLDYEIAEIATR